MHNDSIKNYLFRGGLWAFSGRAALSICTFGISIFLVKLLSLEHVGIYFLALNLITFFSIFARGGMENSALRFIPEAIVNTDANAEYFLTLLKRMTVILVASIAITCGFLLFGGFSAVAYYIFDSIELANLSKLIVLWCLLFSIQFFIGELYRALHNILCAVIFGGLLSSVLLLLFLSATTFLAKTITLEDVVVASLISSTISVIIGLFWLRSSLRKVIGDLRQSRDITDSKKMSKIQLLAHAAPLVVNSFAFFVLAQSDLWFIGVQFSDIDLAQYSVAFKVVTFVAIVYVIGNSIVTPLISRLYFLGETKNLEVILRSMATFMGLTSLAFFVLTIFWGEDFLIMTYGAAYEAAYGVLIVLAFGRIIDAVFGPGMTVLAMTGGQIGLMYISLISATIQLAVMYSLIGSLGIIDVAVIATTIKLAHRLFILFYVRKTCGIWTCGYLDFRKIKLIRFV